MLKVRNISVRYDKTFVLQELDTEFKTGRLTALIGPNGCGKSTLLKAMMDFLPLETGEVLLNDHNIRKLSRKQMAREMAYLPQECQCPDYMTVGELVELAGYARYAFGSGPSKRDRELFADALATVGLADQASQQVNKLSGGQRQRAWIAMVLAQNTNLVLLDEPVNHLDMKYQYAVLDLVKKLCRERGKTVIVVLHDLNLAAAFADEVLMMNAGRIIAKGSTDTTITDHNVRSTFGLDADIFNHNGRLVCLPCEIAGETVLS
ncbi:ABC transporter ATP-binding protein [Kiloniella sp. b19]|uniref:ABC transporter ATP-binding protein n=1 Tax=Kiloniella sp. GXU_MW_B19 TaxID=3141326 RepID=UPI0031D95D77